MNFTKYEIERLLKTLHQFNDLEYFEVVFDYYQKHFFHSSFQVH